MTVTAIKDPRRYFEAVDTRKRQATAPPVCLYLEVTNRCNLLCETCPRTFETLEPPADMTWELFTSIVDQVPDVARVVLHDVGEPMLVKALPRMIRHLKDRGVYVLFNTNGTLLSPKKHQAMIDTGLDELRVSLDAADAKTFLAVRGKNFFDRIVRNVGSFTELQRKTGATSPRISLWLTGLKETIDQLPAFVRLAASDASGAPTAVHAARPLRFGASPTAFDLGAEGIRTVLWATGYRRDYSWLKVPVVDAAGEICHDGGITPSPGLYVLGLNFLRRRRSHFIDGVGFDAAELTQDIQSHLAVSCRAVA